MSALGQKQTSALQPSCPLRANRCLSAIARLLAKEKAAFAGGQCGAAFKSGKGPGTLNALAPYAD
jgi:hypothetical protein